MTATVGMMTESKGTKGMENDKKSEVYKMRREKNNLAVKKSRAKNKQVTQDIMNKVNKLKEENQDLTGKIQTLNKELCLLKALLIEHAGSAHGLTESQIQLLETDYESFTVPQEALDGSH